MLAELGSDLFDDRRARAADRADRERREEVHQHGAEESTEEDVDLREVDRVERLSGELRDLVEVGGEKKERGEGRRSHGVALRQGLGGVARCVETVGTLACLL